MESIQIFLKLDGLFKAEVNAPEKTYFKFGQLAEIDKKKIDLLAILDFDAATWLMNRKHGRWNMIDSLAYMRNI